MNIIQSRRFLAEVFWFLHSPSTLWQLPSEVYSYHNCSFFFFWHVKNSQMYCTFKGGLSNIRMKCHINKEVDRLPSDGHFGHRNVPTLGSSSLKLTCVGNLSTDQKQLANCKPDISTFSVFMVLDINNAKCVKNKERLLSITKPTLDGCRPWIGPITKQILEMTVG